MNTQKHNTKTTQTTNNPDIKHTKTNKHEHTQIQYTTNPNNNKSDIKHAKTHNNEHTKTQYNTNPNKNNSGNKTHKHPQTITHKNTIQTTKTKQS